MRKKELESPIPDSLPGRISTTASFQMPLGAIEGTAPRPDFPQACCCRSLVSTNSTSFPSLFDAVATDLVTGDAVVLSAGSLPDALRASMSVPGVFAPVRIDDRILVDGGMSNNLPVSVVREMGADIVIAVDISSPC